MTRGTCIFLLAAATALAAPKLRLGTTVVGPVSVAAGGIAATQTVEAFNTGDGALSLTVSASAAWILPSVGPVRTCLMRPGTCIPITVAFATSGLARGTHTGTVTVRDPNATDAPQFILATVQAGGAVPDRLEFFAAPNGSSEESTFTANRPLTGAPSTQAGGNWLSFVFDGVGSFQFVLPYKVTARHLAGMAEGAYAGTLRTQSSGFDPDSKTIPVSFRVTSQPILRVSPDTLRVRVAQGAVRQQHNLLLLNRGMGTLTVTGVNATTASGGNWLTAEKAAGFDVATLTIDAGGLGPGVYTGTVTYASNAVNTSLATSVILEVVAQGAPTSFLDGVVNNATFAGGDVLGRGLIAAVFGEQFTLRAAQGATSLPLGTELDGVRVFVNDRPAPVYFVSHGQVNFQIPYESPASEVVVRVDRDGVRGNNVSARIVDRAPRILRLGIGDYAIIVNQDGTFPMPATPGIASRPARAGDVLVIYLLGGGPTTPFAESGVAAPASPLANVVPAPVVIFGGVAGLLEGIPVQPLFYGLTPGLVGLYQVNVVVPEGLQPGDNVQLYMEGGGVTSNRVRLAIQR